MQAAGTRDSVNAQLVERVAVTNQDIGQHKRHLYLILKRVFLRFRYRGAQMRNDAVIAGQHRVLRCHAMDFSRRCVRHRNAGLYVFGIDHGRIQP